jgi:hypothetical protein
MAAAEAARDGKRSGREAGGDDPTPKSPCGTVRVTPTIVPSAMAGMLQAKSLARLRRRTWLPFGLGISGQSPFPFLQGIQIKEGWQPKGHAGWEAGERRRSRPAGIAHEVVNLIASAWGAARRCDRGTGAAEDCGRSMPARSRSYIA